MNNTKDNNNNSNNKKQHLSYESLNRKTIEKRSSGRERLFYFLGFLALFAVVFLWTFSSYLTASVLENYRESFLITIASSLSFLVYGIFLVLPDPLMYILKQKSEINAENQSQKDSSSDSERGEKDSILQQDTASVSTSTTKLPPLTMTQTARYGFIFFLLYFLSNFLLNFALGDNDLASICNLSSTSGFFTLLIGYFAGVEALSTLRIGAVVLSLIATILTVVPDFSFSSKATHASIMALSSAFVYGCYSIYLKVVTKDESRVSMPILFFFVGLYTLIIVVPIYLLSNSVGWITIEWPNGSVLQNIIINAFVGGLLPNYMWNVAFAFTTPLMVAIGLSFSTPLGIIAGYIKDGTVKMESVIAAVIIIASFAVLNLASLNESLDQKIDDRVKQIIFSEKVKTDSDDTITNAKDSIEKSSKLNDEKPTKY